jgi:tetratricopeptide (TPR) repeat protein
VVKAFLEEEERRKRKETEATAVEELRAEYEKKREDMADRLSTGGTRFRRPPADKADMPPSEPAPSPSPRWGDAADFKGGKGAAPAPEEPARRELPEAGFWRAAVVTGEDGTVEIDVPMPGTTTEWRLTVRGVTVETLVGEATANVVTKKDFFVEVKAPASLEERDKVRVLARLHNLSAYSGDAELTLSLLGGPERDRLLFERKTRVRIEAEGTTEALFDAFEVPAELALDLRVEARAGDRFDAVSRPVPVRPWGLELADHGGGVARGDADLTLALPADRKYGSRWLTVTVGPALERAVLAMALEEGGPRFGCRPPRFGGHPASQLLAAVSGIGYAKAVEAPRRDYEALRQRARTYVGALVVSQRRDGGWGWATDRDDTDLAVTWCAFWALTRAKAEGVAVNADTLNRAANYLRNAFRHLKATDNDGKALIVHALSSAGAAEFAHLNRLYRERNSLGSAALAHTALAFVNAGRKEFAGELLDLLLARATTEKRGSRDLLSIGDEKSSTYWYFQRDRVELTALTLLLMLEVRPAAPQARQAVDYLLDRRGSYGFTPPKARGVAVAALAAWFGKGRYRDTDARIKVLVGGREVTTIESRRDRPLETVRVPAELLPEGRVLVEFRKEGAGEYAYAATLRGFTADVQRTPRTLGRIRHLRRHYYHANLTYRGRDIGVKSSSKVRNAEVGQRIRVYVDFNGSTATGYWVIEEPIPSGFSFVEGSLAGSRHHEIRDGRLIVYVPAGEHPPDLEYELVGYATGDYPVLPTVVRDTVDPGRFYFGGESEISVLPPGEKSDDSYEMNLRERLTLGKLTFEDGLYQDALTHLRAARKMNRTYNERDVARMLLWIHTSPGFYDAKGIVEVFEVLRERYPELEIPFDKILVVGRAYRDIGEPERAYLVFRATIDASFVSDAGVSAVLEDEGQFLGSVDFQESLWREYPDTAEVVTAYFALSQSLYMKAPTAHLLAKQERQIALARGRAAESGEAPDRIGMLKEAIRLLESFLRLYPADPLADDAAFSMANAFLDLKQHEVVVEICRVFRDRFGKSDFRTGFQYMEALGHFWQHAYDAALAAAVAVGEGDSKDRDFARYIVGQIHHAKGNPADAIEWYGKVKTQYPDAKEAIEYFEEKRISLEEVSIFEPGEKVELGLDYRNVKEAALQVYRVDLMKLYLREKNLANITSVHLAGIRPELELTVPLGDGRDYVDKERKISLDLTEEAAYLVICRGDDLFASGLVLITPLRIEVQEDPTSGRVRVNVLDRAGEGYAAEVHVKAIGSADREFRSGETDLRGIFVADGLRGKATVIARSGDSRYAFYRGERWLGAPEHARVPAAVRPPAEGERMDYRQNLRGLNDAIQRQNMQQFDQMRRQRQGGVQIQRAR